MAVSYTHLDVYKRQVLMISRDESRPDIRYMYPIKSSLAPEGPAILSRSKSMAESYGTANMI